MNTRDRHPWVIAAMLSALTGCAASGGALQSAVPAAGVNGSWMDPATTGQNLLYISDEGHAVVDVFVYPLGKAAGMLTDVHDPVGLCSDKAGKVWVVDAPTHILEFAHGAEQPEATFEDAGALRLQTCAVNPVSGDLAVVDAGRVGEPGGIAVFAGAKGMPHTYRSTGLTDLFFCAYDAHGNLFVDGLDKKGAFRLVEIPHGSRKVQRVEVDQSVGFPGALSWDGKYLALGDRLYQGEHNTAIYQIAVSGTGGNVKGTTVLGGSCDLLGFATPKLGSGKGNPQAMRVVAPDLCENTVRLYAYPNGGAPIRSFGTFQYPFAATVSPASHRAVRASSLHGSEPQVYQIETLHYLTFEAIESRVEHIEPAVDLVKAHVVPIEPAVDLVEPPKDLGKTAFRRFFQREQRFENCLTILHGRILRWVCEPHIAAA